MKKISLFLGLIFFSLYCFSQNVNNEEVESLTGYKLIYDWGGYGSFETKLSSLKDELSVYIGLKGAAIVNRTGAFGLFIGGFISDNQFKGVGVDGDEVDLSLSMAYGGIFAEYIGFTTKKFHFSVPVALSIGGATIMQDDILATGLPDQNLVEVKTFVLLEAGVNFEINITRELRFYIGLNYRTVLGNNFDRITNKELSFIGLNAGIKIGSF